MAYVDVHFDRTRVRVGGLPPADARKVAFAGILIGGLVAIAPLVVAAIDRRLAARPASPPALPRIAPDLAGVLLLDGLPPVGQLRSGWWVYVALVDGMWVPFLRRCAHGALSYAFAPEPAARRLGPIS